MKTVIKTTDGITVMTLVSGADLVEALRKWKDVNIGKYVSHRDMLDSAIPADREFRGAWSDTTPELVIDFDMPKARTIHLAGIRVRRNASLSVLDMSGIRAADQGNATTLAEIRVQKQTLRDIPQTIAAALAAATTIPALKLINPI